MRRSRRFAVCFGMLMAAGALFLGGCSSTRERTVSTLSAAGFHAVTPATSQQIAVYNSMPANEVERLNYNGKAVYAYADKESGVVYMGNEQDFQRFNQIGIQQRIADQQLQAAQLNRDAALNWGAWGPYPYYY